MVALREFLRLKNGCPPRRPTFPTSLTNTGIGRTKTGDSGLGVMKRHPKFRDVIAGGAFRMNTGTSKTLFGT